MNHNAQTERVFGHELKVGDTIETWFSGGRDQIIGLWPYVGPLRELFEPDGAQTAAFALSKVGMTIENGALFNRIKTEA